MVNLLFLSGVVKTTICPEGADKMRALGLMIVKFPLLYLAGYFLLKVPQFEPLHLLAGFTLLFLIIVLKVLGRALLGMDDKKHGRNIGQVL